MFEHYEDVDYFQLRLAVTDNNNGITGHQILNLTRNTPPSGGNCTFSPKNGTAMYTNFTVDCDGFTDTDDEIHYYSITCEYSKFSLKSIIYSIN